MAAPTSFQGNATDVYSKMKDIINRLSLDQVYKSLSFPYESLEFDHSILSRELKTLTPGRHGCCHLAT